MQLTLEDVQEVRFTVVKGTNPGSKLAFEPVPRTIRIGRSANNDIVIGDPTVSRQHARVEIRADGYAIADEGSSTGLEKMGFRVGKELEPLNSGDEFRIGDTILRFEIVAKKGAMKRIAARESGVPQGPSPLANVVATMRRALATMGLRKPLTQAVGGLCFLALIVIGLWPEPPQIPPQAAGLLPIDYNAIRGYGVGDESHAGGATFEIPTDAEGVGIYMRVLPGAGVEIRAGGEILTTIERGRDWQSHSVITLPRAIAKTGGSAHLLIDHLGYSAEQGAVAPDAVPRWGVGRMRIVRVTEAGASPAKLEGDVTALRELYGRVDDDPRHRYELVEGMRKAVVGLMKLAGRSAVAYALPAATGPVGFDAQVEMALVELREGRLDRAVDRLLPALQTVDVELDREYRRLANSLELLKKKDSKREIAQMLPRILRLIPDPTDVRHRDALDVSRTLTSKDLEAFRDLMGQP